jgi:hypothetical protein
MAYDNYIKTSHNKQKSTWKIIDTESGRTHKHSDQHDLIKKFNDSNVAEQIYDYLISIGNKTIKSTNSSDSDYVAYMEQMISKPSTTKEIEKIIKSFQIKDSSGYDQISLRILKSTASYISLPLNYICKCNMEYFLKD